MWERLPPERFHCGPWGTSAQRSLFNHLECVVDQVAPVILLPSQHARRQWHLQPGGYFRRHRVHERQRDFSQPASRAAHRTATCAAGESSIPTIIPRDELPDDIAVLLSLADRPLGRCGLSLPHDGNGGGGFAQEAFVTSPTGLGPQWITNRRAVCARQWRRLSSVHDACGMCGASTGLADARHDG